MTARMPTKGTDHTVGLLIHEKASGSASSGSWGTPAATVFYAIWFPVGAGVLTHGGDAAVVFLCLVPVEQTTPIRQALVNSGIPELAEWLKNAASSGEGWKALRHGRAWTWCKDTLKAEDFSVPLRGLPDRQRHILCP